ncbi:MAG: DUF4261 domain-containing protein [Erysipelotrichaceae bacterium]|nr:DUF4261 domain-containing protein [Erysipelotrichaceae bacterium]
MNEKITRLAQVYSIQLLFSDDVIIDYQLIYEYMKQTFGYVEILGIDKIATYALKDHLVTYRNGEQAPFQLMLTDMEPLLSNDIDEAALIQCWNIKNPKELLSQCHYKITIADFMSARMARVKRCQILSQYLDIMLALYPECMALYFPHAQKLMSIKAYQNSQWEDKNLHFLDGGLNIRLYNIENSNAMVVDTLGMRAIGLPDLQMRFYQLDVDEVVACMYRLAAKLFLNGDYFNDGDFIEGRYIYENWQLYHRESMLPPKRLVLDIYAQDYSPFKRSGYIH